MKQVPDRTKLRREYLRKKTANVLAMAIASPILLLCGLGVFLSIAMLVYSLWLSGADEVTRRHYAEAEVGTGVGSLVLWSLFMWVSYRVMKRLRSNARKLAVVPPLIPDHLPAEEVLVRGSEEPPVAQSEVLLRAAQQGQKTPKEELLRAQQAKQL